jgi:hypothetical protein
MTPSTREPIVITPDGGGATVIVEQTYAEVTFHVDSGHLPPATRRHLVDAVLALPELTSGMELRASVPLGDPEILEALREHCDVMTTHSAGSTCLVDGVLS